MSNTSKGNIVGLVRGLQFSDRDSLALSGGWITLACVCNFICTSFVDRLGRVRSMGKHNLTKNMKILLTSLVIGFSGTVVTTSIEAAIVALYGTSTNKPALAAGVAMLFLTLML